MSLRISLRKRCPDCGAKTIARGIDKIRDCSNPDCDWYGWHRYVWWTLHFRRSWAVIGVWAWLPRVAVYGSGWWFTWGPLYVERNYPRTETA